MRLGTSVQIEPMPVKTPSKLRVCPKGMGIGNFREIDPSAGQCRIGSPEAFTPSEIWESGVHSHAGASGYEQTIRMVDQLSRLLDLSFKAHEGFD